MNVDIKELFAAGAHFGHKTSRWHPKMRPYIHSARGGIHIINLEKTVEQLEESQKVIADVASKGRQVLLVSTKQQARNPILSASEETSMPYVINRWMGGTLTNFKTISGRIKHLKELEKKMASGELNQRYSKLEVQRYQEEIDMLNEQFGGIKELTGLPGLVVVLDVVKDDIAVKEARKLGIPVVGVCDTNADPSQVDYPVACNDDAIKALETVLGYVTSAIKEGQARKPATQPKQEKKSADKPAQKKEVKKEEKKPADKKAPANKPAAKKPAAKKTAKEGK